MIDKKFTNELKQTFDYIQNTLLKEYDCGTDCSSLTELQLSHALDFDGTHEANYPQRHLVDEEVTLLSATKDHYTFVLYQDYCYL